MVAVTAASYKPRYFVETLKNPYRPAAPRVLRVMLLCAKGAADRLHQRDRLLQTDQQNGLLHGGNGCYATTSILRLGARAIMILQRVPAKFCSLFRR
jgi:hypothetical protein